MSNAPKKLPGRDLSGSGPLRFSLWFSLDSRIKFDTVIALMTKPKHPLRVMFFQSDRGREPVREWLKELPPEERKIIGEDIKTVQWGWPLGMPLVRSLGDGLFEVRSSLKNRIARVL
jgi:hypothetical protein